MDRKDQLWMMEIDHYIGCVCIHLAHAMNGNAIPMPNHTIVCAFKLINRWSWAMFSAPIIVCFHQSKQQKNRMRVIVSIAVGLLYLPSLAVQSSAKMFLFVFILVESRIIYNNPIGLLQTALCRSSKCKSFFASAATTTTKTIQPCGSYVVANENLLAMYAGYLRSLAKWSQKNWFARIDMQIIAKRKWIIRKEASQTSIICIAHTPYEE